MVFRPLLDAQAKAGRIAAQMGQYTDRSSPGYLALSEEYNRLQSYFEVNEGYNIDVKIRTILNGMGFADKDADTPCDTLSGGEKTRLALVHIPGIVALVGGDPQMGDLPDAGAELVEEIAVMRDHDDCAAKPSSASSSPRRAESNGGATSRSPISNRGRSG